MVVEIRPGDAGDCEAINRLFNQYIENTAVNFDLAPWPLEKRREWLDNFNAEGSPYRLLVGEVDGVFAGFACNTKFRPKAAYDRTTEITVYVEDAFEGHGLGQDLLEDLIQLISAYNFHRICGVITLPNPASVRLHEKLGFSLAGEFDEIGWKFDRYHTVAMYQRAVVKPSD